MTPSATQGGARPGGVGEKRPPRGGRDGRCPGRKRPGRCWAVMEPYR
ncbi:hypothetical protein EV656_10269 [Rhodovulum adriaticum]|uniref:Uncharacterized protein n=1 Tax=Rhodovulum adriaticum TaxID=35804 RepID=A0A4R2NVW0_RHOAD|nr:hypothetical protein EV656_10269 [Rhodovulum adriaticum]